MVKNITESIKRGVHKYRVPVVVLIVVVGGALLSKIFGPIIWMSIGASLMYLYINTVQFFRSKKAPK